MAITFSIASAFNKVTNLALTAEEVSRVQAKLNQAAAEFNKIIEATATITIDVTVKDMGGSAASAGSSYALKKIITGVDGNGVTADAAFNVSPSTFKLIVDGTVPLDTLIVHEMSHALGFISGYDPITQKPTYISSELDKYLTFDKGTPYFTGSNAVAIAGERVKLDSSLAHVADEHDLMGPYGDGSQLSMIDMAMFKDFGYTIKPMLVSLDNHTFIPGSTTHHVTGTGGIDTVKYSGASSQYSVSIKDGQVAVTNTALANDVDQLVSIERLQFDNGNLALDIDGNAGKAYRLYQAAFDRKPDLTGLGYWIEALDNGTSLKTVAHRFITSPEFVDMYGAKPTVESFVMNLYKNIFHREPDKEGYDWWVNAIKTSGDPEVMEDVLAGFSESDENEVQVIGSIQNGIAFTAWNG